MLLNPIKEEESKAPRLLFRNTLQLRGRSKMSLLLFDSNVYALFIDCLSDEVFEVQRTNLVSHWRHQDIYIWSEKKEVKDNAKIL